MNLIINESFEITIIEINKHKVGGTVAFNWAFTCFFNSYRFGDIESRTRNGNHGCVLSVDSKMDKLYMLYKLCKL